METTKLKEIFNSPTYDFLRENPIYNQICLLTTGGSIAYGTDVEGSDVDLRGIYLNSKREILTMKCTDKPFENRETDTSIFPLKQMVDLLIACNPNVIEVLGTKRDQILMISQEGWLLRLHYNVFLSKRVAASFGGYATAQLRRLQNALARDNYPQPEKEKHILGSIENSMDHLQRNYQSFTGSELKLYIDKSEKNDFDTEIFTDIDLKHYPLRDFRSMLNDMLNVVKDYGSLNHRNNKKDELHLNKHAMHLVRLLIMGAEILEGKGINTYRENDREFLLKIRSGEFVKKVDGRDDYSEVFALVDEYEKKFKYAAENTTLPDEPNYEAIYDLVEKVNSWNMQNFRNKA